MLIYTDHISPRLEYTLEYLFKERFQISYELTTDIEEYSNATGSKIFYSKESQTDSGFCIKAAELLFSNEIVEIPDGTGDFQGAKLPFITNNSQFPVDPFANIFFFLSRYEEYLSNKTDEHGRYCMENSFAFRNGFYTLAIVDRIVLELKVRLQKHFPGFRSIPENFAYLPTYDIDIAYSFRHKGLKINLGGAIRSFFKGNFSELSQRIRVLFKIDNDPYDSYELMRMLHDKYELKSTYFIHCGKRTKYDKSIPLKKKGMQTLIRRLKKLGSIGLHPSYYTTDNEQMLKDEIEALKDTLGENITRSRQHYLRFRLPETYSFLEKAGIEEDYSMGFASQPGFRAGTSRSFLFYNLKEERTTKLRVHPLTIMDGSLVDYMKLDKEEAKKIIDHIVKEVKDTKGTLISLWHNESMSDEKRWKGWNSVYEYLISKSL